jgi:uncharacterized protein
MDSNEFSSKIKKNSRLNISISWPIVALLLVGVIVAMLLIWKPWSDAASSNDRTVTVQGDATIKAEPDEFVFNPTYEFKNANKEKALAELTKKSDEVVDKLKAMGIDESKIKTNASGNNYNFYFDRQNNTNNYSLTITITIDNLDRAQEIQDYLVSTNPTGSISPHASFSEQKRKQLESQARNEATKDARAKAEQSAQNLGFEIGKVKSVEDGNGFGGIIPMYSGARDMAIAEDAKQQSLSVQPGENDLNYSVKVVYFLK